ncbi:MAG: undecaprenyl-phosphate glucose phosphotransferase [Methylobacter sp.]|jgi:putative colanic acid biosynthesis UDP-glucose lipid carrier transferase|nr:undecaprenyl-phosphate glucose phosphotransferase [Methylobacter sp.]
MKFLKTDLSSVNSLLPANADQFRIGNENTTWPLDKPSDDMSFEKTLWQKKAARLLPQHWSLAENKLTKAVIVGLSDLSRKLTQQFKHNPLLGVGFIGFFDDRWPGRLSEDTQPENLLGGIAAAAEFVKTHNIQHIYIALPMSAQPRILALLDGLHDTTASIYFVPDILSFNLIQASFSSINGIPIIAVCETPFIGINDTIKRISDVLLSLLILLPITPLMLLIAAGIKLSSPGPVLFKQRRYGLNGQEIIVYKFRSMSVMEDGECVNQATRSDPRITRFGGFLRRTSLDELPQFINVLQGRMSIVGPRPHAISHNEMYRSLIKGYMIRHKVKPGITGLAQINGFRGETDTVDKMQRRIDCDLDYLRNWSLWLDLSIIFKTIAVVIEDQNAY